MESLKILETTVADRMAAWLAETGIRRVYVYPGGTIAPLVNGFIRAGIAVEVFKHEQGAAYAALAQARLSGQPQVVMVTSGPGVTNVITPLADAFYDSTPLLLITGQIGTPDLRSGRQVRQRGFQEVPTVTLTQSLSKAAQCVLSPAQALEAVVALHALSTSGRPGPVVLDLPMDVQRAACAIDVPMPVLTAATASEVPEAACGEIASALAQAQRPVMLLGHGALRAAAFETYLALADRANALVVTSLLGLGAYPSKHPRFLGYLGHTGHAVANQAVHEADLVLALGTRLDVRQTGTVTQQFVPNGRVAWINDDPDELAYPRVQTHWSLQADAGACARSILRQMPDRSASDDAWLLACQALRSADQEDPVVDSQRIAPKPVLQALHRLMDGQKGIVTTGVGCHQHWAARHLSFAPDQWRLLTSAGHGTMGYDIPTAVGAAMACPGSPVLCVVGDGSLLMNIQELASISERRLPIKVLVLNNARLGIVSQFQKITWNDDPTTGHFPSPDFAAIARGFGIEAEQVDHSDALDAALVRFWQSSGPRLLDVRIDPQADVVPMLLGGQTMDQMWQGYPR